MSPSWYLSLIYIQAAKAIPKLNDYEYHWATKSIIILYLKNTSAKYRTKRRNPESDELAAMFDELYDNQVHGGR
jgi:hypothetical protein